MENLEIRCTSWLVLKSTQVVKLLARKKGDGLKKKLSMKVTREREELDKQEQLIPFGQIRVGSPDPHHHFPCPRFRRRDTHFALYLYR